eukprot:CAMPEP_0182479188 /NCGR_PEP_ID=MMETSP1319-20130603/33748_1 /TAXON_ID=172717 /ORGANISM="Bolidomonas pacifica, Strain RCC208" /LENGTH=268 /DNA_ID=CAMNT_0024680603 /DNA_START=203 /DNA_END=1006 /DNA_ORIENTATION=-
MSSTRIAEDVMIDEADEQAAEARALKAAIEEGVFDKILDTEEYEDEDIDDDDEDKLKEDKPKSLSKTTTTLTAASSSGTYNTVALNACFQTLSSRNLPWAETLDCISPSSVTVPSHDDLKLELSFLHMASSAVSVGRSKFAELGMPFGRPLTYFAEMLKSDAHMAKVKDRLLFESKKMAAFEQRKANKEMKGREKEARGNKRMRKDEEKRRGMEEVEAWKKDAERMRSTGVDVDADHAGGNRGGRNFKRENADKKYGHGGKRGKFRKA